VQTVRGSRKKGSEDQGRQEVTFDAIDLFAGPGGWDLGAKAIGMSVLGIEWDSYCCRTRYAAGLPTIRADVATLDALDFNPIEGLIGSPPCQPFSRAGKGKGRAELDTVLFGIADLVSGNGRGRDFTDHRTELVLQPLRWALQRIDDGTPFRWIALEQVPDVLPVWKAIGRELRFEGYSVATGIVHSECFGVAQTRQRAVLLASRDRQVHLPRPTHSRYYSRHPDRLDPGVAKWVTMSEALGWGMGGRPSYTVTGGGTDTGGAEVFGHGARQAMQQSAQSKATVRDLDSPAPTITAAHDRNERVWVGFPRKDDGRGEATEDGYRTRDFRGSDVPAQVVTEKARSWEWVGERPATTVVGTYRPHIVSAPGYRLDHSRQNEQGSVAVSVEEAAVLQGFPADHPWRGPRTQVFQQIGNAFPPLVARAVLETLKG